VDKTEGAFPTFAEDLSSRIWCTYRKNFPLIPGSLYTSDIGWGCMHRTAQMTLAQALLVHYLGRDWRYQDTDSLPPKYYEIIQKFRDHPNAPYSLHNLALVGEQQGKSIGDWYGPSTVSVALRELVHQHQGDEFGVYVSDNGMIFTEEVDQLCGEEEHEEEWRRSLLLLIPVRLGVENVPPMYCPIISSLFRFPQSLGVAGGKPRSSLYFVGMQEQSLFYLDPHVIFGAVDSTTIPFDTSSYRCSQIQNIQVSDIDPSFAIAFYCRDRADFQNFCDTAVRFQEEAGGDHIFSISTSRQEALGVDIGWPEEDSNEDNIDRSLVMIELSEEPQDDDKGPRNDPHENTRTSTDDPDLQDFVCL